jgi:hypothetical protein
MTTIEDATYIIAKALFYQENAITTRYEDQPDYIKEKYEAKAYQVVDFLQRADYWIISVGMGQ